MTIGYISPFFAEIKLRAETDHQQTKANIANKVFSNVCGSLTSVCTYRYCRHFEVFSNNFCLLQKVVDFYKGFLPYIHVFNVYRWKLYKKYIIVLKHNEIIYDCITNISTCWGFKIMKKVVYRPGGRSTMCTYKWRTL